MAGITWPGGSGGGVVATAAYVDITGGDLAGLPDPFDWIYSIDGSEPVTVPVTGGNPSAVIAAMEGDGAIVTAIEGGYRFTSPTVGEGSSMSISLDGDEHAATGSSEPVTEAIVALQAEVAALDAIVADNGPRISALESTVADLESRVAALEAEVFP